MTQSAAGAGRRGRGRPPRLSREQIVGAAIELVEREPAVSLTIKGVADAVGSAPMALYRYFPDRDTLLQAAADHVIDTMEQMPLAEGSWQEQLRTWMRVGRERLRPYPQLLPYMIKTRRTAGIPSLARLSGILRPAGLADEDRALAVSLVNTTLMGHAMYEGHRRPAEQTATFLEQALDQRPAEEAAELRSLISGLPAAHARLYDTIIEQTIAAIEGLAGRQPS